MYNIINHVEDIIKVVGTEQEAIDIVDEKNDYHGGLLFSYEKA